MPKFFMSSAISGGNLNVGDTFEIVGDDAHHISKTLRMKAGDRITVTNGASVDHICSIASFTSDSVLLEVLEIKHSEVESDVRAVIFQALVKGDKMETVIQKSVELGVYEIYPVAADRSVVKLDAPSARKKVERWNKIALEAAKQCGRGIVPTVHDVIDFKECVAILSSLDKAFFCYELAEGRTVKDVISGGGYSSLGFYIGPEGGISPAEAELATDAGIVPVSLGKLILRTETAGPSVLAMILYETRL